MASFNLLESVGNSNVYFSYSLLLKQRAAKADIRVPHSKVPIDCMRVHIKAYDGVNFLDPN